MGRRTSADAVVVGCGVIGASVAYHLAERGLGKILIIEKEAVPACGSSGKSAGGIRKQFDAPHDVGFSSYSMRVYEGFAENFGEDIAFKRYGYLYLAHSKETLEKFRRRVRTEESFNTGTRMVTPDEIGKIVPGLRTDDLAGGTFNSTDGYLDPHAVIMGFLRAGRGRGVQVVFGEELTGFIISGGRVSGVQTNRRKISTPRVVVCVGPWSREVGRMAGVEPPIRTCARKIFVTGKFERLAEDAPFVIDDEDELYFRREMDGVLMSPMEVDETDNLDPAPDWSAVEGLAEKAVHRFPAFSEAAFKTAWAGIRTLSPDGSAILGLAGPEGTFTACGMSGHGFCHAPAVGAAIADAVTGDARSGLDIKPYLMERFY
jgi:sarcosine oxidase subunit beta